MNNTFTKADAQRHIAEFTAIEFGTDELGAKDWLNERFIVRLTLDTNSPNRRALEPIHRYGADPSKTFDGADTAVRPDEAQRFETELDARRWLAKRRITPDIPEHGEFSTEGNVLLRDYFTRWEIVRADAI